MKYFLTSLLALFILMPSVALAADNIHDCIVVVLDASGSMDEHMPDPDNSRGESKKMFVAKRSLKSVVTQVPSDTHVGLVVFNGGNIRWAYDLGPVDVDRFTRAVDAVSANGGTPLGESMKKAADRLMDERDNQMNAGRYKLLVVTDGEAGRGDPMEEYTREIVARGIRVDTIGVAMPGGKDHTLATLSHSYQGASDSVSLETALRKAVVAEAGGDTPVDFSLFEGLDPACASAWIGVLTQSKPNHGIGERAPAPPPEQSSSAPAQTSNQSQPQPASCNAAGSATGGLSLLIVMICGTLAVLRRKHAFEAR